MLGSYGTSSECIIYMMLPIDRYLSKYKYTLRLVVSPDKNIKNKGIPIKAYNAKND